MAIRSFLAFELPAAFRCVLTDTQREMRDGPLEVRWVRVDAIHLTVIFMGDVEEGSLAPIRDGAAGVCRGFGPFETALKGVGIFGTRRAPRVLWAGLGGALERMAWFRDALQDGLKPYGIQRDTRPFSPHLTLARFRKGARSGPGLPAFLARYRDLASPVCTLEELVLFKSDLTSGGAVYSRLDGWPLRGER